MTHSRAEALRLLENFVRSGPSHPHARAHKALFLFGRLDHLIDGDWSGNWLGRLEASLSQFNRWLTEAETHFPLAHHSWDDVLRSDPLADTALRTGEVYFQLWKDFNRTEYFDQATSLLGTQLERNNISLQGVTRALDNGCGGGRYTQALKNLGCASVIGIDISQNSIDFAQKMNPHSDGSVTFVQGSVLAMPFPDGHFDFVFSNGVLHHTTDTLQGMREIFRVLRPGGRCWLYLYGCKETLLWDTIDTCRTLLNGIPQHYLQAVLRLMGFSPSRIFHRCDAFYPPIQNRYFKSEVEAMIQDCGFSSFRFLTRGTDYDYSELVHAHPDWDPYILGEGEMRYLLTK